MVLYALSSPALPWFVTALADAWVLPKTPLILQHSRCGPAAGRFNAVLHTLLFWPADTAALLVATRIAAFSCYLCPSSAVAVIRLRWRFVATGARIGFVLPAFPAAPALPGCPALVPPAGNTHAPSVPGGYWTQRWVLPVRMRCLGLTTVSYHGYVVPPPATQRLPGLSLPARQHALAAARFAG